MVQIWVAFFVKKFDFSLKTLSKSGLNKFFDTIYGEMWIFLSVKFATSLLASLRGDNSIYLSINKKQKKKQKKRPQNVESIKGHLQTEVQRIIPPMMTKVK